MMSDQTSRRHRSSTHGRSPVRPALQSPLPTDPRLLSPTRNERSGRRCRVRDVPDRVASPRRCPHRRRGAPLVVPSCVSSDRSPVAKHGTAATARRPVAIGRASPGVRRGRVDHRRSRTPPRPRAAARLNNTDVEVLRLVAWEQLSFADIAALLEIEPNAVKQRLQRAKQNLAREYRRLETHQTPTPDAPTGGAR